ncbi:hypothetical protein K466DRAFT_508616 [Polyporus arcularius HHB13444]|uniref:Transmembrane protein n=1 Tax=Polyporus arcularius HHB13444 TaxID=1314778 RepID=A0A5C3PZC2_9APHY|nr:hypothetical protein K466DRAFT_508616 [Polyporus arcularius HHB13444]
MPGPAVYAGAVLGVVAVFAVGYAFHEFVYEPHIAPKVEAWAENFIERRQQRRRQRQGPVAAQPVQEHGDENRIRRSTSSDADRGGDGTSIELAQLAASERDAWRDNPSAAGLRHRNPGAGLDESDVFIPHPVLEPTHVLFNTSEPPSPGGHSIRTSAPPSLDNSPAHPTVILEQQANYSPSPSSRIMSPRLLTPMSLYSEPSSPSMTPATTRSPLSSRRPTPDLSASLASPSAFHTPLGGSVLYDHDRVLNDPLSQSIPTSRIQSPFSDIHSVDARSSPEHISAARSPFGSPQIQSPSIGSDLTLDSDDEFDIMSPRSGIFSPASRASHVDDDPFDVVSQHGSEASWSSVDGRHSPVDF